MKSNVKVNPKEKHAKKPASGIVSSEIDAKSTVDETVYCDYSTKGIFTLKYEVNEKGIGQLLLPPSLSLLLQSDRVSISPSAGGLFIRSV